MTTTLITPSERLALSRERLRHAMRRPPGQPGAHFATGSPSAGVNVFDLLKLVFPAAATMIDAASRWWAGHTGLSANALAGQLANEVLRPLAKRHPVALVAGAAAVGALLIWIRPWRFALRPKVLSSFGSVVLSSVLASGVLQAWLTNFITKVSAPTPNPTHDPNPGTAAGTTPDPAPHRQPNANYSG